MAAANLLLAGSPPASLWAIANQLQLLLLLVLTKSSIPRKVVDYITGNSFASFNFEFLKLTSLPGMNVPLEWIYKEQEIEILAEIGVESGSTFNNHFTLFIILLVLVPIHLIVL